MSAQVGEAIGYSGFTIDNHTHDYLSWFYNRTIVLTDLGYLLMINLACHNTMFTFMNAFKRINTFKVQGFIVIITPLFDIIIHIMHSNN